VDKEQRKNWYQEKAEYHFKAYQHAVDNDDTKASDKHMQEYLNYTEMDSRIVLV